MADVSTGGRAEEWELVMDAHLPGRRLAHGLVLDLADEAGPPEGVIDLGCGTGEFCRLAAAR